MAVYKGERVESKFGENSHSSPPSKYYITEVRLSHHAGNTITVHGVDEGRRHEKHLLHKYLLHGEHKVSHPPSPTITKILYFRYLSSKQGCN